MPLPSIPVCTRIDEFGYPVGLPETVEGRWTKRPGVEGYEYFQITTRRNPPPYSHGQFICKRRIGGERPLTYYTEYENARKGILSSINTLEAKKKEIAQELKNLLRERSDITTPAGEPFFSTTQRYITYSKERGKIIKEKILPLEHEIQRQLNTLIELDDRYFPTNETF